MTPFPLLCLLDAPLFLSHPHFYNADPVLAEAVLGLHPNQEEHSLFLDVHPVSLCLSTYGGGVWGGFPTGAFLAPFSAPHFCQALSCSTVGVLGSLAFLGIDNFWSIKPSEVPTLLRLHSSRGSLSLPKGIVFIKGS